MLAVNTGTIGEHITIVRLMKMGVTSSLCHIEGTDVVAYCRGKLWRIQVKTSRRNNKDRTRKNCTGFQFQTNKGGRKTPLDQSDCDIVALVSYEDENVLFVPVQTLRNKKTFRVSSNKFYDETIDTKSWDHCMTHL